jgi:hypothetical protein
MGRLNFRQWIETLRADGKLTEAKKPLEVKGKNFEKAKFPEVDWRRFT